MVAPCQGHRWPWEWNGLLLWHLVGRRKNRMETERATDPKLLHPAERVWSVPGNGQGDIRPLEGWWRVPGAWDYMWRQALNNICHYR
jgi:hypothetical protein